ncbi:SDR family NAD(P)-dependent oxidoreductase [Streptomyces sp. NBC_01590]|uniref:SDR family NAD(P)-dependent oxidoreductase n=1 Tax=Streptomyces sp. NBC_01590 TaxID=2975887 RepID=UPI00386861B6
MTTEPIAERTSSPIAVIGVSCRLPMAPDPVSFWRLLHDGVSAVGEVPDGRPWAGAIRHGAFLDSVDEFDAPFFGISPREATTMDPQQRLMLQLGWEAAEDARILPGDLRGSRTGVFVGAIWDDYARLLSRSGEPVTPQTLTGTSRGVIANRLSYALGVHGPSLTVDTAQSSSLVAVHLAVESLRRGECTLAIAGGVNLNILPESAGLAEKFGGLSPDGRCYTFDQRANGYVRGEGGGAVLLKPLSRALADGDPVYCTILGSAMNSDGTTDGLTVPSPAAQAAVIRAAYRRSAVDVSDVGYVELHGTGTRRGDPVEAEALGTAIGRDRHPDRPLLVGSAKTNVGHLEGAAGIVGLLKTVLSLEKRQLPASLNFSAPPPTIALAQLGLRVQCSRGDWPRLDERPLVAGVSSFGMGGTNCHVVLAEAPRAAEQPAREEPLVPVWLLSAKTAAALGGQAGRLLETAGSAPVPDIAWSLANTRTAFEHRAAVVGTDRAELVAGLTALATGMPSAAAVQGVADGGRTAFLFSGQGAQRAGAGRELYERIPAFATAMDEILGHFDPRLREVMFAAADSPDAALLHETAFTQAALFSLEVALFRVLESWGVRPDYLLGHSIGELAAAHVAGVLSLADACVLVAARGRLMQAARADGAMVSLAVPEADVRSSLPPGVDIAAVNGPAATVIAGDADAVVACAQSWAERGHKTRRLRVSHAFHSAHMDSVPDELSRIAAELTYREPQIPVISNVTGALAGPYQLCSPDYWARHVREAVRFHDGVGTLREEGVTRYLELGPDAVLAPMAHTALDDADSLFAATMRRDRPEPTTLFTALAQAHTRGLPVDWATLLPGNPVALPTYAFERHRYWPGTSAPSATAEEAPRDLLGVVRAHTAAVAGLPTGQAVDPEQSFRDLGFDSMMAVELAGRLTAAVGVRLPDTLVYDCPTPAAVAAHVSGELGGDTGLRGVAGTSGLRPAAAPDEPIAIVGMACRYPGGLRSPEDLWKLAASGTDAIGAFPRDRGWDLAGLYDPDPGRPGHSHVQEGGFLDAAAEFDADFFGISPREAAAMDPQQRLLLETAWEAVEHAGIAPDTLRGSQVGVFVGATAQDYGPRLHEPASGHDGYLLTGSTPSVASGRIAYALGLSGPAVSVDTACSSSLVAMHLAGQSIRQGECSMAIVGGATVLATPGMFVEFSTQRGLSPDGRCRAFAAGANGTGWAEGVGVVLAERLSDAVRLGHPVLAVIRGSAVNQDGASNGLTAPSGPAQQRVIRAALANAGLRPADVDAVEAHGTGTTLGDPIEAQALLATYGQDRETPLWLGSLKSNIGHTQAAAGIGGVIKMVQAMRHELLPRTLHVDEPTPRVDWSSGGVRLLTEAVPWPARTDRPRRAAVSSFGISGTNAHLILEEPSAAEESTASTTAGPVPWKLSARTPEALRAQARRLHDWVAGSAERPVDIAYSLASGRTQFTHGAVVLGSEREDFLPGLAALADGTPASDVFQGTQRTGRTVFVFPGQGSQWTGMALELAEQSDVFATALDECAQALETFVPWKLHDILAGDLNTVDTVQPALFAVMVSLARLWQHHGIHPDAVIGHSQGEIAAAHIAGALTLHDAARIITLRSQALTTLAGTGAMASVMLPAHTLDLPPGIDIAAINGPTHTILSGDPHTLETHITHHRNNGTQARLIPVDYASHSTHVEPLHNTLNNLLAPIQPQPTTIPLYSTVTNQWTDGTTLNAEYWYQNLRRTVRFGPAIETLATTGHDMFVEVSPHPVLAATVDDTVGADSVALSTLRRGEGGADRFRSALCEAGAHGAPVDWTPLFSGAQRVDLPTYPFQGRRFWLAPPVTGTDASALGLSVAGHPLLGATVDIADEDTTVLTGVLSLQAQPWLADHAVLGTVLVPGAALVELALHTGDRLGYGRVDEMTLEAPLVLPGDGSVQLQLVAGAADGDGRPLTVHSRAADGPWTRHAAGRLTVADEAPAPMTAWPPAGASPVDLTSLYDRLLARGYEYGPAFQGARAGWQLGDDTFIEVALAEEQQDEAGTFGVHPALLDALLHPAVRAAAGEAGGPPLLPFSWSGVTRYGRGPAELRVRVSTAGADTVSVAAYDTEGAPVLGVEAMSMRPFRTAATGSSLYTMDWAQVPADRPRPDIEVCRVDGADPHDVVGRVLDVIRSATGPVAFVTCHALAVRSGDPVSGLATSPAWGLVRTAQSENPDQFLLIDVDESTEEAVAVALATGEPQVAVREGVPYAPRLTRATESGDGLALDPDGTVLITGGTGTLGALVARRLVSHHGVTRLLLVSRRGADAPDVPELVAELSGLGAQVSVAACDITDREALDALLSGGDDITAVVHAAGVLDDGTLGNLTGQQIDRVLRPKIDAAWNLHELVGDRAAFVLFSSATALLGSPGQGNYTAANAYLDALAQYRTAAGLPSVSLAWGLWAVASGMTGHLDENERAHAARNGLRSMATEDALALFDAALATGAPVVVPAELDLADLRSRPEGVPAVLRGLVRVPVRRATRTGSWAERMAALAPAERETALLGTVRGQVAAVLGHDDPDAIDTERAFSDLGFDSLTAVELRNRLGAVTGLRLPPTLVFEFPTPGELTAHLGARVLDSGQDVTAAPSGPLTDDPIAVVGMACRYPGGVRSPEDLWELVATGRDAIGDFPDNRGWDLSSLFDTDPGRAGTSYTRRGGFLYDADQFDPAFFGINPREASAMDPQQRLLLETAWESFERAGIDPASVRGSQTGVFLGLMYHDYGSRLRQVSEQLEGYLGNGSRGSVASGRVAYVFGLQGPAVTVDTACSSSLVSLHLAARSLRDGECDVALAGGAAVMSEPDTFVEFSRQRGLAPDGRCKSFAAAADGTGWSEGVGLLVLQRLSDARRAGRPVLAVIRGSAVNQDGASNGLTAPSGPAQQRVIRAALANAGLRPADVDAVEAHGTGTTLGDPIEAQALLATYGQDRETPLWLGSLKSNIGHTQAAAGVAGVIKMIMAARHGALPRTLHVDEPSPHVDWSSGKVRLLTESTEWPRGDRARRFAVSAFGVSGTNSHVILEDGDPEPSGEVGPFAAPVPWVVSARTETALRDQAERLREQVADDADPVDVGYTLAAGRADLEHRAVVLGRDVAGLRAGLGSPDRSGVADTPGRTVFVFPGQGSQWTGMALELAEQSDVFATALDECAQALETFVPWKLHDILAGDLNTVDTVQPALFAVMVSLARLWQHHGIHPDAVIGHSQGEIAAAHIAGALTLHDAARIITLRSQALTTLAGTGAMASVMLPAHTLDLPPGIDIAAINGPTHTILSGDPHTLETHITHHRNNGTQARLIPVDYASHSTHVEPLHNTLNNLLAPIQPQPTTIPLYSTVTNQWTDGTTLNAEYWYQNLRRTVRFGPAIETLATTGHGAFVEVSPHPVVMMAIQESVPEQTIVVGSLRRDDGGLDRYLTSVAEAYVRGVDVDWTAATPGGRLVDLPTYAFQRRRFWLDDSSPADVEAAGLDATGHPLLGAALQLADSQGLLLTGRLGPRTQPWLADHAVHGTIVLPGTAFLDLALHAGRHSGCPHVDELTLTAPLIMPEDGTVQLQLVAGDADDRGRRSITVHSRTDENAPWTEHATGVLGPAEPTAPQEADSHWPPRGATAVDLEGAYDRLAGLAYEYGPVFQGLKALWRRDGELFAEVAVDCDTSGFDIHPALLDAALHPLILADRTDVVLPFSWRGVSLCSTGASTVRVRLRPTGEDEVALTVTDPTGAPVVVIESLALRPVAPERLRGEGAGELFRMDWMPGPVSGAPVHVATLDEPGGDLAPDLVVWPVPPTAEGPDGVHAAVARALGVVQDWLADDSVSGSRLVVHTSGAVDGSDLGHAAVWGLIRSVQTEHPDRVVLADLDDADASRQVLPGAAITGEPQVVVRGGKVTVPRLGRVPAVDATPSAPAGPVLITGGTGTLGGLVARHLVTHHGVGRLVLASRTGRAEELATDLAELGAEVTVVACDVSDRAALADLLTRHAVRTVIHAAGVLDDAPVTALTPERVSAVLKAKADAAWHLHELIPDDTALVLFSSVAAPLGTAGQAGYAAANSFLDALAQRRRAHGLPTVALNWGLWSEASGMTRGLGDTDVVRLSQSGVAALSTQRALALLDDALARPEPVLAAFRLDRRAPHAPAVLRTLIPQTLRRAATDVPAGSLAARAAALPAEERDRFLVDLVRREVSAVLGHAETVDARLPFKDLGFDSLTALELRNRLSAAAGIRLPATVTFDHPTPDALAALLGRELSGADTPSIAVPVPSGEGSGPDDDPIAIVAMACRYPGADSPEALWDLVAEGVDAVGDFPADRGWDIDRLYDPDPSKPGTTYTKRGAFLPEATAFDAEFFGMSPREALATDPQQRLLLQITWEALERAGIDPATLRGSRTGVFAGIMANDYGTLVRDPGLEGYLAIGNASSVASGRVSYTFGLEGPALTVDTACSSSLVAVHLAGQALRRGECTLALASGVTVMSSPAFFVEFSRQRGLSPDGRCRSFAEGANGTGWSEGAGVLVLERLSDAVRNGHPVLGLVRGSAVNQDGASNGLTAPNGLAQQRVIADALAAAGLAPSEVDAVEAHGTGTVLGDPIEAQALQQVYGTGRAHPLSLGSIKSNIGHSQAAAGMAGIIKMIMSMRHGTLPRTLHVDEPTQHVDWEGGGLTLLTEAQPWRSERPRRAGVSSFGISGTNAHVILEQPPSTAEQAAPATPPAAAYVLSGRDDTALRALAGRLHDHLAARPELQPADIGLTLGTARSSLDERAAIVATDPDDLVRGLAAVRDGHGQARVVRGRAADGGTAFMFSGQGSQRVRMGAQLHETHPVFAEAFDEVCAHFDLPLREVVFGDAAGDGKEDEDRLARTEYAQPALFAVEVALYRLITSMGVRPDVLIGHSIGEITAAHVAGVLSMADACALVAARGRLMQRLPVGGAMVSLPMAEQEVRELLTEGVDIAAVNGPRATVVSGNEDEVLRLAELCAQRGLKPRRLRVSHAFHSHHMDPMVEEFRAVAEGLTYAEPTIPVVSNVTGTLATELSSPDYWVRHVREAVRFEDGVRHLAERGVTTAIEIGPDAVLSPLGEQCVDGVAFGCVLRRDLPEAESFALAVAHAYVNGRAVLWPAVFPGGRTVPLPTYPFRGKRFWPVAQGGDLSGSGLGEAGHPLLAATIDLPGHEGTVRTGILSTRSSTWLADHVVGGSVVVPGTLFAELVADAADAAGTGVKELTFQAPLVLAESGSAQIQVDTGGPDESGCRRVAVYARADEDAPWTQHVHGTLGPVGAEMTCEVLPPPDATPIDVDGLYERLSSLGLDYGPAFRGLAAAWRHGDSWYAEVQLPEDIDTTGFHVHPALLDAALHPLADAATTRLPFSWTGLTVHGAATDTLMVRLTETGTDTVSVLAADPSGALVLSAESLVVREVAVDRMAPARPLFRLEWARTTAPAPSEPVAHRVVSLHGTGLRTTLAHALSEAQRAEDGLTVFLTHNAVAVTPGEDIHDLSAAAAWGLIRSAQSEQPDRFILIDTDHPDPDLTTALATGEPQLALRNTTLYTPHLTTAPTTSTSMPFDPDGTILITGGTGTLGTLITTHLITTHQARHILIASRQGPHAPNAPALQQLGARITPCDVGDPDQLAQLIADIPAEHPLTAVIHCAGQIHDATLHNLTPDHLDTVLATKAEPAQHLHELTRHHNLAAFVLFSSAAGTLGNPGQANYAAANTYLDALAHHRTAHGLPATSIAWGPWAETSTMTTNLDNNRLNTLGIQPLPTDEALRLFDTAFSSPHVVAVRFTGRAPKLTRPPTTRRAGREPALADRLAGLNPRERDELLLDLVRAEAAAVLGYDNSRQIVEDRLFTELGFDSLTSLELRNRLNTVAGLHLPATVLFDHPTPHALATRIHTVLGVEQLLLGAAELSTLEADLPSIKADGPSRSKAVARLRELLTRLTTGDEPEPVDGRLQGATDSEIFDFIDNELGSV